MSTKGKNFVYLFGGTPYINLTNRCCNDCTFCLRGGSDGVGEDSLWLDYEPEPHEVLTQFETVASKLGKPPREVVFCGFGEPCYRVDVLCAVASVLRTRGIKIRLNTNGLGNLICGRDITDDLAGVLDVVSISLNASNATGYQELCKPQFGQGSFDALMEFAKTCAAKGIQTILSVVEPLTADEIAACRRLADRVGATLRVRERIG